MASDDDNDYKSDEDINPKQHSKFLQDVFQLDKKQYVKKPTRTEPTTQVSEFNLVKTSSSRTNTVNIEDLTKSLEKKKKHVEVSKRLKSAQKKAKILKKPLEKPQRERIKRSVGFKEVKLDLGKWDAIVTKNRVSSQLNFPLNEDKVEIYKGNKPPFQLTIKSKLDEELEKLEPAVEKEPEVESFPLTMKEILEKRREMARLRAHQSYQEAKYHRQNKIKSKKFHRIQRKERIKNQIKDFEKLQKTDPEEALRKLEELEKTRAEERMSLRHRSTGQWAKNKQIRAKYDKETRQELAQQLAISRELTQNLNADSSSESEDENFQTKQITDKSNPWINGVKTDKEIDDFISGYRKFWDEKNKREKQEIKQGNDVNEENNDEGDVEETNKNMEDFPEIDIKNDDLESEKVAEKTVKRKCNGSESSEGNKKSKDHGKIVTRSGKVVNRINADEFINTGKKSKNLESLFEKKLNKENKNKVKCTSEWEVQSISEEPEETIEELFEDLDEITEKKVKDKLTKLKKDLDNKPTQTKTKKSNLKKKDKTFKSKSKTTNYMELPREKLRPEIDEELYMDSDNEKIPKLRDLSNTATKQTDNTDIPPANIDPDKYLNIKTTHLDTFLPDNVIIGEDNEDLEAEDTQKAFISEAFAGDDVVADFTKEKKDTVDKDKPQDVDLSLPGWGSWGGKNIKPSKRKKRRFIIKFPKEMPRRDDNKGRLIINETQNENLKKHLVSEVPFPFRSVKDFEASIRAPVGDTFVPQSAFRRLIKPSVVIKKGEIIKPMDDEVLIKHKFTKSGMVVKR